MHVHLTCSQPTRSLVIAAQAMREMLRAAGHRVTISWPETFRTENGERCIGFDAAAIAAADVVVHSDVAGSAALPDVLEAARAGGRPVLRFEPGGAPNADEAHGTGGDATRIARLEDLVEAVATAAASSLG